MGLLSASEKTLIVMRQLSSPPESYDPGAVWVVTQVIHRARRLSPFDWGQGKWKRTHRRETFAYLYVGIALAVEAVLVIALRLDDPWRVVSVITATVFIWRFAMLIRHYLELLLSWEHDLRYGLERNLILLFLNFVEFTLLGCVFLFLTTAHARLGGAWFASFATLTLYDLPRGGCFLHEVAAVALAGSAFLILACGLAVILSQIANKFDNRESSTGS